MAFVTPPQLAQSRSVGADSILRGEVDLRAYPFRHLAVSARPGFMGNSVTQLMEAVEHLSNYGWELVNVASVTGSHFLYAFLRRV
ncbi:hypothetical protein GA0074696_0698 [Micromonospora purpureochromogenes]|uniref:DUF4177 domain-containing protein n=1 Tax=Micromonospora purpureochromogenes TaxID=47872 RepID=A0A1C4UXD8_9ACTN|nr:hypothetical protein [Micromonospora purpureochromogenes]SCE76397.1 hypothetical protein GA0074696_0698 [Micromonospora purpureochromogenes]